MDRHELLTVSLVIVITATGQTSAALGNTSDFPGKSSEGRLAYFRWQQWLLSRPAVRHKIPPLPALPSTSGEDRLGVYTLFYPGKQRPSIYTSFSPATVFYVDTARQTVEVSGRLMVWWKDSALAVDQNLVEEFTERNVTLMPLSLAVPVSDLWLPRIIFAEGYDTLNIFDSADEASVLSDGTVCVIVSLLLTFSCRFIVNDFPFDEHHCPLTLYAKSRNVDIFPSGRAWDTNIYQEFGVSGEWDLINVKEETISSPSFGNLTHPRFVLHLRRKTTFYSVVMLFPMVLTSYLNVLVFLLPPDLGDKASYLVTLTVSMSVYVAFFNTDMPRGLDSMPRIFILLIFVYAESFCILLMCLAVLREYAQEKGNQETETATTTCASRKCYSVSPGQRDGECVRKYQVSGVSAKQLDTIFFVVAFVVNTMSMAFILASLNDKM